MLAYFLNGVQFLAFSGSSRLNSMSFSELSLSWIMGNRADSSIPVGDRHHRHGNDSVRENARRSLLPLFYRMREKGKVWID